MQIVLLILLLFGESISPCDGKFHQSSLSPWSSMDNHFFRAVAIQKYYKDISHLESYAEDNDMIISVCSVCGIVTNVKESEGGGISHGYCPDCAMQMWRDMKRQVPDKLFKAKEELDKKYRCYEMVGA